MHDEELARILMEYAYQERQPPEEPFTLASGRQSWHYFDCKRATAYAPAMPLIGAALYPRLLPGVRCVGGPTRGADPIADALAYYSLSQPRVVHTFSVRKETKTHGTEKWIEGLAQAGDEVAVMEDVVTSGGSALTAVRKCRDEGLRVAQVLLLVDREEGGLERLRSELGADVPVEALYTFSALQEWWKHVRAA